ISDPPKKADFNTSGSTLGVCLKISLVPQPSHHPVLAGSFPLISCSMLRPPCSLVFPVVPEPRVVLRSTIRNSSDRPEPWAARLSAPLGDIAPAMQFVDPVLESLAMANTDRATTRAP